MCQHYSDSRVQMPLKLLGHGFVHRYQEFCHDNARFFGILPSRGVTEGVWQSIKCYLWYSPSSRKIWMRFILSRIECPELMYNSPPVLWKRKRKKLLRFPQLKWCIFQKSLLFYRAGFITEAIRQRLIGSHRRGFTQLSQQTTDRDYHLGGDISFLCQLVNRWSL